MEGIACCFHFGCSLAVISVLFACVLMSLSHGPMWMGSTVAMWQSARLETEGPRVGPGVGPRARASPVSFCCVIEQDTFILA